MLPTGNRLMGLRMMIPVLIQSLPKVHLPGYCAISLIILPKVGVLHLIVTSSQCYFQFLGKKSEVVLSISLFFIKFPRF